MDVKRTERISVNLTPEQLDRIDRFAQLNRWSRSTAIAVLAERALDAWPFR